MSRFEKLEAAPPIAIFALSRAYQLDQHPNKVDLGIGAYRDDTGKPWVLPVVKKASEEALADGEILKFEYLNQLGLPEFTSAASKLLLGPDHPVIKENRLVSCQTLSGTGALALTAALLNQMGYKTVYVSKPTWGNHIDLFKYAGFPNVITYRYWDAQKRNIDFQGLVEDLKNAPKDSVVILHACAHNPTGIDPNMEQWKQIADICEEKSLFPLFDCAYQGFASGNPDKDIESFRYFVSRGFETICCQSFAKNFGLYNQRVGHLAIFVQKSHSVEKIKSQLALLVRKYYSNPPAHGARLVAKILNSPTLYEEWKQAIELMSSRILSVRSALRHRLEELLTPGSWNHITDQIGMFSYTGLTAEQVAYMKREFHIYLSDDGRISLAGLNTGNVDYVARAINKTVKTVK